MKLLQETKIVYPTMPRDYLLVKVDRQFEDTLNVAGTELELDTSYDPNWHVRIYGEIVQLPKCITLYNRQGNVKDEVGIGTVHDVQVGDKVYFHFHTVHEENRIKYLTEQNIYKLHHKQMFCVVRDGRIIMLNDRVLVQPKREAWETYITGGTLIYKKPEPKSWDDIEIQGFGLVTKTEPDVIPRVGVIRHVSPKSQGLHVGETIHFAKDSEFLNSIESEDYFVMTEDDILGKYFN